MDDDDDFEENERRINLMILGNSKVGKTCFILRYTDNIFQEVYLSTIGIDFKTKTETVNICLLFQRFKWNTFNV